ncbi:hypothetical protein [Undibacterium umbellatum]|uniref:Uncharacterized protein n=1 Tax=Undibacterium umbellatum TaxID=2762300 RepID=A0ABR6ZGQ8_9BURK|nr:hypothetical protein [Undibacterium umbellatum]MBC3910873.1 hypothetical protein [Undibacterium umbellatum]
MHKLLLALMISICCDQALAENLGDFINTGASSLSKGCIVITASGISSQVAPESDGDRDEFNTYFLLKCKSQQKQFVLWRSRVHMEKDQLVGELVLGNAALDVANFFDRHSQKGTYIVEIGSCKLKGDSSGKRYNAFVRGDVETFDAVPIKNVIVAWRVVADTMELIEIPKHKLQACEAG